MVIQNRGRGENDPTSLTGAVSRRILHLLASSAKVVNLAVDKPLVEKYNRRRVHPNWVEDKREDSLLVQTQQTERAKVTAGQNFQLHQLV